MSSPGSIYEFEKICLTSKVTQNIYHIRIFTILIQILAQLHFEYSIPKIFRPHFLNFNIFYPEKLNKLRHVDIKIPQNDSSSESIFR